MPTYDYSCEKCDHTFEVFHGMNESPSKICPECGGAKFDRIESDYAHYSGCKNCGTVCVNP